MMPSRLTGGHELDGFLGRESPSKEVDSSCWGRKKKKKNGLHEDLVGDAFLQAVILKRYAYYVKINTSLCKRLHKVHRKACFCFKVYIRF